MPLPLNHERVTVAAHGTMAVRALHRPAGTGPADGRRVIDLGRVRALPARAHARLEGPAGAVLRREIFSWIGLGMPRVRR